jgi:hypothetical protein
MKKQIIEVDGLYAVRLKKWYHFEWQYVGRHYNWTNLSEIRSFCLRSLVEADKIYNSLGVDFKIIKQNK